MIQAVSGHVNRLQRDMQVCQQRLGQEEQAPQGAHQLSSIVIAMALQPAVWWQNFSDRQATKEDLFVTVCAHNKLPDPVAVT